MKTLEYTHRDKERAEWGKGPWLGEPDKKQWTDRKTGLPCLAVRGPLGSWCGYVGVTEGHPCFNKSYQEVEGYNYDENGDCSDAIAHFDVHGGLTYSAFCQPDDKETGICHLVEPGENDRVWWFGFDTGHGGDYIPGMVSSMRDVEKRTGEPMPTKTYWEKGAYRTLRYIEDECKSLAKQLAAVK